MSRTNQLPDKSWAYMAVRNNFPRAAKTRGTITRNYYPRCFFTAVTSTECLCCRRQELFVDVLRDCERRTVAEKSTDNREQNTSINREITASDKVKVKVNGV